jgi:hypothetical protein
MKFFITYLLIVIFFAGAFTSPLSFKVNQKIIRSAMKKSIRAGVDKSQTETFTLFKDEVDKKFHFIHSKEFRFKNKLYDIISKTESADSTTFIVINDENEERLIDVFRKFKPFQTKLSNVLYFKLLNTLSYISIINYVDFQIIEKLFYVYSDIQFHTLSIFLIPDTPPPKLFF